jgi:hypothetical protein
MLKQRIEDCLTIGPPRGHLNNVKSSWYWKRHRIFAEYSIRAASSELRVWIDGKTQRIALTQSSPYFGGTRWWFQCPKCGHRVTRLHRPIASRSFLCRNCYELTYESSQRSRSAKEGPIRELAKELGVGRYVARQCLSVLGDQQTFA